MPSRSRRCEGVANPFDAEQGVGYHGGNFLGQYVGIAMDHLRYYLGLLAKHLNVQIALLVTPVFSNRLPPSLVGNPARKVKWTLRVADVFHERSAMPWITWLRLRFSGRRRYEFLSSADADSLSSIWQWWQSHCAGTRPPFTVDSLGQGDPAPH